MTKKQKKDKKSAKASGGKKGAGLKALAANPLVADVVAAALVGTAAALKDSRRARALASDVGEELGKLSKAGSERGNALWDMALEIGKRSLSALSREEKAGKKNGKKSDPKDGSKKSKAKKSLAKDSADRPGKKRQPAAKNGR